MVYPVVYPNLFKHVTPPAWATPGGYVYIHRLLHRLGCRIGNHRQLPFGSTQWVTDMPICRCCHCRCS